jgi:hypothetical protein
MGSSARRLTLVAVVSLLIATAIAGAAVLDHRQKTERMGPANEASWYCANRNLRCSEPQAEEVIAAWHGRERYYRTGFGLTVAIGVGCITFASVMLTRRRTARRAQRG